MQGEKKTDGAKDGWVGHWLGSNPSSGLVVVLATARLTLFTPSHAPRRTRTPLSPKHISFATHFPPVTLLCVRAETLLLVPFFFFPSHSSYKCGHLHAEQVRESSQATLLAAAVLVGRVRQHFGMQRCRSNSENINEP